MRKLILAAGAAATLVAPTAAMASTGHKTPTKDKIVKVCVSKAKHGFKARVSAKCKPGEKAVTLKVPAVTKLVTGPQGPGGAAGATGATGPAGAFVVEDANGNVVGTLVGFDGYNAYTMLSNGSILDFYLNTGQVEDTMAVEYASSDCTGPGYIGENHKLPFVIAGQNSAGDPLYATGPAQTVTINSYNSGTGCQTSSSPSATEYPLVATGYTQPANAAGPLTITQQ